MSYNLSFDKKTALIIFVAGPLAGLLIFWAGYRTGLDRGFRRAQAELSRPQESLQPQSGATIPAPAEAGTTAPPASSAAEAAAVSATQSAASESNPATPEPLQPGGPIASKEGFTVQIGAYQTDEPAQQLKDKFSARGYSAFVFQGKDSAGQSWFVVRIGHFKDLEPATRAAVTFTLREKTPAHVRPLNEL